MPGYCPENKGESMHSFTIMHESRNLKQARPINGQYVDLLRTRTLATPSTVGHILPHNSVFVKCQPAIATEIAFFTAD